jgi:hypothetical protein
MQKDQPFVQHIYDILKQIGIVGAPPNAYCHKDKRTGNYCEFYYFATFTLPYFTELHAQWYVKVDNKHVKVR